MKKLISIRLYPELLKTISEAVKKGIAINRTDLIERAVIKYLKKWNRLWTKN